MRLAALVLALAPLATTRAEVVHVLEDFSDAQRFFTDAGASLGPGFWDSGAMNATATEEGALRVDYETWWAQLYGYRLLSRAVPDFQPGTNAQRRGFAHHHHCHSSVASKRSLARSLSLGSTNRSSPARPSRAVADAPPPARPHISWALPEHKSYLQTSNTHVAVCQRISLPPPDDSIHRLSHDP